MIDAMIDNQKEKMKEKAQERAMMGLDPSLLEGKEQDDFDEFNEKLRSNLHEMFSMKRARLLVDRYTDALDRMEKDLGSLDSQVTSLTAGDLRIAKKREGKIKFNPSRDAKSLEVYGKNKQGSGIENRSDDEARFKRKLFKKCFNKKNMPLGRMTKTVEKIIVKKEKYVNDLEKLLLRS